MTEIPQEGQEKRGGVEDRKRRIATGVIHLLPVLILAGSFLIASRLQASATDGRFSPATDGLGGIRDSVTGLIWQEPDDGMRYTWSAALGHCAAPWRLPTVGELSTLLDMRTTYPTIDPMFANTGDVYWSSSPVVGTSNGWSVPFNGGYIGSTPPTSTCLVRCVR